MPRLHKITAILFLTLILASCSQERRLAGRFITERRQSNILFLEPSFSYKFSYKIPDSVDFEKQSKQVQDSLIFFNSALLQYVDDSLLFSEFNSGFAKGLNALGYNFYDAKQTDAFMHAGSGTIVNLTQVQLEEYYDSITDEASFSEDERYNYHLFITAINFDNWFEISSINTTDTARTLLYITNKINDNVNGGFRYFPLSGDVKYSYTIDSLKVNDIYSFAAYFGNLYAGYFLDYQMNNYVETHLPRGVAATKRYTYDRFSGSLRRTRTNPFTRLN